MAALKDGLREVGRVGVANEGARLIHEEAAPVLVLDAE
jgi:hypothetical protein